MTAPRHSPHRRLVAGIVLIAVGIGTWLLYAVAARSENTSFNPGDAPPAYVRLVQGHTYWIAVPNGVRRLREVGVDPSHLSCTAAEPGQSPGALPVTPVVGSSAEDTKFVNRIGSFVAARSYRAHVACNAVGGVYVENAADAGFDWSGLWLLMTSAALVVGLPLFVSGLRRPRRVLVGAGEDDQVE